MSAEQQARDMLEAMGYEDAQQRTAGDVVFLANLIRRAERAEAERDEFSRSIDRICTERDKQLLRVAAERDELRTYSGRLRALLRRSQEPMTADQWAAWHRDTAAALAEGK